MRAILVEKVGGPDAMVARELDAPVPGPGQACVRVEAAGVNFIDVYQRTGQYAVPLPVPMGLEGAGVVEAVGDDVALRPGARVAWTGVPGSYATHVLAPADRLVPIPDAVDTRIAAAAMLQGMTAHYLSRSTFPLGPDHTCLVHAAAGGVGLLLCQLARRAGARVLGTTSTEDKAARARAAGADEVILYSRADFVAETRRLTDDRGVDVVYDSVGASTFEGGLDCLVRRGTMVLYGQSSGPVPPLDLQVLNQKGSLYVTRPSLFHYIAERDELERRAAEVLSAIAAGALTIHVDRSYPLAEAPAAHRALEARRTSGKLLLVP
jgi:NADPH:quinone reductase